MNAHCLLTTMVQSTLTNQEWTATAACPASRSDRIPPRTDMQQTAPPMSGRSGRHMPTRPTCLPRSSTAFPILLHHAFQRWKGRYPRQFQLTPALWRGQGEATGEALVCDVYRTEYVTVVYAYSDQQATKFR